MFASLPTDIAVFSVDDSPNPNTVHLWLMAPAGAIERPMHLWEARGLAKTLVMHACDPLTARAGALRADRRCVMNGLPKTVTVDLGPLGKARMPYERMDFLAAIHLERGRQIRKWGEANQDGFDRKFAGILGEEFGEVCRALLEGDRENLREELVQVAAVCARAWERLDSLIPGEDTRPGGTFAVPAPAASPRPSLPTPPRTLDEQAMADFRATAPIMDTGPGGGAK